MYYYILNPAAGKGAVNQLQDKLRSQLQTLGISGEFIKTTGPGDATRLAERAVAKGYKTVVAVGGDGTVTEIINGIPDSNVAIGIIPIGNTNLLAERLGITDWQQACAVLAARRITNLAAVAAGQSFFLSTLSLGFDTDVDKTLASPSSPTLRQQLNQFSRSWSHARNFQTLSCHLTIGDVLEIFCPVFTLSVTNQKFLNPQADNKLIVSLSDRPSRTKLGAYLWRRLKHQNAIEETATTRLSADKILVRTDPPTGIMVDGKLASRTPIAIRLTDRQFRFISEKPANNLKDT
jgi:diacylglycerol kinase family enzyme